MSTAIRLGRSYWKLFTASAISNLGDGVGQIAYPWLATAITRNPVLIALVMVVQRLPWLLFSLPAGVITDRVERRSLMVRANVVRAAVTMSVAAAVLLRGEDLPSPAEVEQAVGGSTDWLLYGLILAATLLLGMAEVLYDNAAQTIMPSLVVPQNLEKANGRLWSAEMIANTFAGPPLAAALLALAFAVPFLFDATTFAVSAVLITLLPAGATLNASDGDERSWTREVREGFGWLWRHLFLRRLAIVLGLLNMLNMITMAIFVLFAQEVLDTGPTEFALLTTGAAAGGIAGGWTASAVSRAIGTGPSLGATLVTGALTSMVIALTSFWPVVWLMMAVSSFFGVLWNVITVSLRQTIIPDHLLGRVNSVYRFFGWGMLPIGAVLGGAIVAVADLSTSREAALRAPWIVAAIGQLLLALYGIPRLTTARIEAAKAAGERRPSATGS